jgi:hypothetical protein
MNSLPEKQKGASAIVTLIILVVLGYAVYIGIQYVPQMIESKSIDSILSNVRDAHKTDRIDSVEEARQRVVNLLQINEMNDMTDSFDVKQRDGKVIITFNYDRELNLIYETKPMHYEKTLNLN